MHTHTHARAHTDKHARAYAHIHARVFFRQSKEILINSMNTTKLEIRCVLVRRSRKLVNVSVCVLIHVFLQYKSPQSYVVIDQDVFVLVLSLFSKYTYYWLIELSVCCILSKQLDVMFVYHGVIYVVLSLHVMYLCMCCICLLNVISRYMHT